MPRCAPADPQSSPRPPARPRARDAAMRAPSAISPGLQPARREIGRKVGDEGAGVHEVTRSRTRPARNDRGIAINLASARMSRAAFYVLFTASGLRRADLRVDLDALPQAVPRARGVRADRWCSRFSWAAWRSAPGSCSRLLARASRNPLRGVRARSKLLIGLLALAFHPVVRRGSPTGRLRVASCRALGARAVALLLEAGRSPRC